MIRGVNFGALRATCFIALVTICFPSAARAGEQRPATLTTKELQQQLLEAHARIRAWYVVYESARKLATGEPSDYSHQVVAAKAPDRFFHWSAHGYPWSDWREDLFQQRLTLAPNQSAVERPAHRQYRLLSVAPDAPLPGTMPGEFLFLALGWWPFPKRPPPSADGKIAVVFPAIARSPHYVVNPHQELVQGRWCHILEYLGHDRLWLDGDRGCAILAREVFDPNKGILLQRVEAGAHREVHPGIWVPFEFRNMLFDPAKSKSQGGEVVKTLDANLEVLEVRLNEQVSDDIFRFEPLPGSVQTLADDRTEQSIPGGTDYLDEIVDWAKRYFGVSAIPAHRTGWVWEALLEYGIIAGGVIVLIGLLFHRRRRLGERPSKVVPGDNLTVTA
jgi:hypothetical protein